MGLLYTVLQQLAWSVMPALFRIRVLGRENVPREGGALIASNHQSYLDPVLIGVGLRRPVSFMARASLFRFAPFARLIRALNAFPVEPGRADIAAVRAAVRRVRQGAVLLVFPEGTRTFDGGIGELKKGGAMMAVRAGAPVVPAVIDGAFEAWPRCRALFEPRTIWVAFGRPLAPPASRNEKESFEDNLRNRLLALHGRLRRRRLGRLARQ